MTKSRDFHAKFWSASRFAQSLGSFAYKFVDHVLFFLKFWFVGDAWIVS
jgi:hypothetical protein